MPPRGSYSSPWFLARISDATGAPNYSAVESWLDATSTVSDKVAGRYADKTLNPARSVTGATFSLNEIVLMRSADGAAGLHFEIAPLRAGTISGVGTHLHVTRWNGTTAVQDSTAVLDDSGNLTVNGSIDTVSATNGNVSSGTLAAVAALLTSGVAVTSTYIVGCYARQATLNNSAVTFFNDSSGNGGCAFEAPTKNFILTGDATISPSTAVTASYAVNRGTVAAPSIQVGADATVSGLVFKGGLYISGALSGVGTVTSVSGTTNQIAVATGTTTPVISLTTAQDGAHTWANTQTYTVAPVFTDQSGSRTALGLGTAAVANTGTSGHTLGFLDGANTWSALPTVTITDAVTNTTSDVLVLDHESSGTPAALFGADLHFKLQSSTTASRDAAVIRVVWATATDASRKAQMALDVYDTSIRNCITLGTSGSAAQVGFLGATPAVQQTGDAGTALVTFGLMSGTPTFGAANLTGTTLASSVVTSSLTAVGTIVTGTWHGTKIGLLYGGTNADLSATGAAKSYLKQSSAGAAVTVGTIPAGDYPDFVAAGASHAVGGVPDPGATAHTNEPYLLAESAAWVKHSGKVIHSDFVATAETTTSTTPTNLATTQAKTFTVDVTSSKYVVAVSASVINNTTNAVCRLDVDVDGTPTRVAQFAVPVAGNNYNAACACFPITLAAGSHTVSLLFSVSAGTGTFANRGFSITRAES